MNMWKDFEMKCTEYLNNQFGNYAHFIHQGGSNSTIPDILVRNNNGKSFYIDVKYCPAQCGQFVLLPNFKTCSFEYSKQNINKFNLYTECIINHMNDQFYEYCESKTAGKDIKMPNGSSIFSNWIVQTYKEKGVEFFIINDYSILPIEHFQKHFKVTAKYRIKRSGSSSIGKNKISLLLNYIKSNDYSIINSRIDGNKLFIQSNLDLHNTRFILQQHEYMFSQREQEFEIRKLSNTYNANVIFQIKQNNKISGISKKDFISKLQMMF